MSLLIAARHFDALYSWNASHKKAIEAGVSAESIKELANNMLAMLLNTFQVDLKDGDPEPFPDVRGFARVSTQGTESPGPRSG
jgi:hypothetical protein